MNRVFKFLLPPVFPGDEEKTRQATLLHIILLAFLVALLLYSLFTPLPAEMHFEHWLYAAPIFLILASMLFLNRQGQVKLASVITILALVAILIPASINTGGVRGLAYAAFIVVVLCAGLLINETAGILTAAASILAGLVFAYLETTGAIPASVSGRIPVMVVWAANAMFLFMSAVILSLAVRSIQKGLTRSLKELEERTSAQEKLRQSEQRLQTVFENMPVFLVALDENLTITYWNRECERVIGYKAEEIVGSPVGWQILIPDVVYRASIQSEMAVMPYDYRDFEIKITCKDGIVRSTLWSNISQQQPIAGWYSWAVGVDVTGMRQAEMEMRLYNSRLETLRQVDQDILAAQSPETIASAALGKIRQLIPCRHADISLVDLKAGSATVLAIDSDGSSPVRPGTRMSLAPYQEFTDIARRQKVIQFRDPGELPHGYFEGIIQSGMVVPLFYSGELVGTMNLWSEKRGGFLDWQADIARDVADLLAIAIQHTRLNQATQRQLDELTKLHSIALAGMEATDEDSLIQSVVEIIGEKLIPDILVVRLLDEQTQELYYHTGSRGMSRRATRLRIPLGTGIVGKVAASGQPWRVGDVSQDPDYLPGNPDIHSEMCVPLKAGETVLGVINIESIRMDAFSETDERFLVTLAGQLASALQRLRADQAIRHLNQELEKRVADRTNQLEAKARELETFAYSVSHDLKAPLRGIDGYSRLLLEEHSTNLNEEGRTFLNTIRRATDQMNQLINDLLDYSRVERRSMIMARVNMDAVIHSLLEERKDDIEGRQTSISVKLDCAEIYAELEGFNQAMRNLLDNAIKFSRDVEKPVIEIGSRHEGQGCVVWVKDNGIGFDPQYHDRIFEIFQRLHRAEDYPGTGVGLALVSKVMKRLGGRAWAESTPGHGATFFLEFPGKNPS